MTLEELFDGIRYIDDTDGIRRYVAKDFCTKIGINDYRKALSLSKLLEPETKYSVLPTTGGEQRMIVLTAENCIKMMFKKGLKPSSQKNTFVDKACNEIIESFVKNSK